MKKISLTSLLSFVCLSTIAQPSTFFYGAAGPSGGGGGGSTNLTTNLVFYAKMDEVSGTRADSTPNGNNLTDVSANTTSVGGIINLAANFNGSAQLAHPDAPALKLGVNQDFTISVWEDQPVSQGSPWVIVDKGTNFNLNADAYLLYFAANTHVTFNVGNGTTHALIASAFTFNTATTNHIVCVYSSSQQKLHLYINGVEDANSPVTWTGGTFAETGQFSIGEASAATGFKFNGWIDEFALWDRALTPGGVTALYNSGAALPFSSFPTTLQ